MSHQRFFYYIEKAFNIVLISFTSSMFVIVVFNVFMRFIMNNSIGWADELSRFIFVWISFLGAILAFKSDEHVGLGFLVDKISSFRVKQSFLVIQQLIILVVLFVLTYYGYIVTTKARNVSSALSIPFSIVYFIVPFSALLMCLLSFKKILELVNSIRNGFIETESGE